MAVPTRSRFVLGAVVLLAVAACSDRTTFPASEPVVIANPAPEGATEPNLSTAPDGSFLLTWTEPVPGQGHRLRFSRLREGTWETTRTIAAGPDLFVNWADVPSLIELPSGRLVAHYLERNPDGPGHHYGVRIVQSTDGGETWSDPVVPYQATPEAEYGFAALFRGDGEDDVSIIWLDGRPRETWGARGDAVSMRHAFVSAAGQVSGEQVIDRLICDCCQPAVAWTNLGPVVAYRDRTEDEVRDVAVARRLDGGWQPGETVHEDGWRIAACPVNGPAIAADGDRVAVAWFTAAGGVPAVHVAFSGDAGASFAPPVRLDEGDPIGRVALTMTEGGIAVVTWLERSGPLDAAVRYRYVRPAGTPSAPGTVGAMRSRAGSGSGFPRVAAGSHGVLFAWMEPGESGGVRTALAGVR